MANHTPNYMTPHDVRVFQREDNGAEGSHGLRGEKGRKGKKQAGRDSRSGRKKVRHASIRAFRDT